MPAKLSAVKTPARFPKNATFEPPEHSTVKDRPGIPGRCAEFFEYWKRIGGTSSNPNPRADLLEVRWYLHKPKILLSLIDPKRKANHLEMITGPLWFENPEDYMTEVPKRMGAGAWHVCINETGVHNSLMDCYFEAGSWDDYPPKIDLKTLVVNDPVNEDYKRWLAAKGIKTPWDSPDQEDEDMQGEVVKTLLDTVKEQAQSARQAERELTDIKIQTAEEEAEEARQEAEEARERAEEEAAQSANVELTAVTKSIEIVATGAKAAIDMVTQNAGSQLNTVEVMKTAADLFRPKEDAGVGLLVGALKEQSAKMLEMQAQQLDFMRSVVGMQKGADGTWTAVAKQQVDGASALDTEITRFTRMAELLGYSKPGGVQRYEEPRAPEPPRKGFMDIIAENPVPTLTMITTIFTLGANIIYNIFASKQGGAISPQEALQKAQAPPPVPQQQPQQQQQPPQNLDPKDPRRWAGFPAFIYDPFRTHLLGKDQGLSGYTFAEFVLSGRTGGAATPEGRQAYESIKQNLGLQNFIGLMRSYPQTAQLERENPQSYLEFVQQFFTYDEWAATQQGAAA